MVMNIKLLVLALLGTCLQNVNGSKNYKERKNGGRLMSVGKFGLGLLSLNCAALTGNSEIDCPGQSIEVIQAAEFPCDPGYSGFKYTSTNLCECLQKCENLKDCVSFSHGDKSQKCEIHESKSHSQDTYRADNYDPNYGTVRCYHVLRRCPTSLPPNAQVMMNYIRCSDETEQSEFFDKYLTSNKDSQPCSEMQILYENAKKLAKCISKGSAKIVENAKARILGKNISHEANVEMFEDYLATSKDLETKKALELVEIVEKIKDFDFFRVKGLESFDQPQSAVNIKWILENYAHNFDRVEEVVNILKRLVQNTGEESLSAENMEYVYAQALEPWIRRETLENIEKYVKSAESFPNKKLAWEMQVNRIKKKYDL